MTISVFSRASTRRALAGITILLICFAGTRASSAATTQAFTNVPVTVICPSPQITAYLESNESPPHFSKEWQYFGGHAGCRTVKSDRSLLITRTGSVAFHGKDYKFAEVFPEGVIVTTDGFGGPYYVLSSRIKKLPNEAQMKANTSSFLPTPRVYGDTPTGAMP